MYVCICEWHTGLWSHRMITRRSTRIFPIPVDMRLKMDVAASNLRQLQDSKQPPLGSTVTKHTPGNAYHYR